MTEKILKPKRTRYLLSSEIEYVDIDKIRIDGSEKQSFDASSANEQIVKASVKLYEYDAAAPPLLIFPHSKYADCYHLIDGFKRLEGAIENNSIKQLPCIVIKAKNLADARLVASVYNASVHNIRNKRNLAYHIIDTLDKSYRSRKLTRDLSISNEELLYLSALSGESDTTCNRALAVFRDIFNELFAESPGCAAAGLKKCFLDAIKSKNYPELKDFYEKDISVLSFSDRRFERVNKLSPGKKRQDRQLKQKTIQAQQTSEPARETYTIILSDVNQVEDNLPIIPVSLNSNENNRELNFINQLKAMSSIDDIDLSAAKEMIHDFLLNNPESKPWVNLFFNCVRLDWRKLKLLVIKERPQVEDLRGQQSLNLASMSKTQSEDNQLFVLTP